MAGTETLVSLWHGLSRQVVSDLPRRPVWLDKSRHFVHTFCTNKLYVVATCRDGWYGRTTSGNLYIIWLRCVNILQAMSGRPDMVRQAYTICLHTFGTCLDAVPTTPCRDNLMMSYLCRATASPAIQNGRKKVCRAVSRIVATRMSQMSCTVHKMLHKMQILTLYFQIMTL